MARRSMAVMEGSMKITKRVREEAATLLSAAACCGDDQRFVWEQGFPQFATASRVLAVAAFNAAKVRRSRAKTGRWRAHWAEAEALLRTGWSPE